MGFFKEFKDDLSQAVNELVDESTTGKKQEAEDDIMVDTLEAAAEDTTDMQSEEIEMKEAMAELTASTPVEAKPEKVPAFPTNEKADEETAIITAGLKITGDIESSGSIELLGTVIGNVSCKGKLSVSGKIDGNTHSSAFFANKAEISGNISCDGSAKIGNGSVIIGDLAAASAVIAGAIKGDIDVHGPVVLDTTAIVMGDIKSKAVQINNGAVIEGHCSQCYADNSPSKFFKDK